MKHVILMIVLAVLKESYPLNPEILKYDQYIKDFETTGRQLKREKNKEMNPLIVKREDQKREDQKPPGQEEPNVVPKTSLGCDSLAQIRAKKAVYVDRTEMAYNIITDEDRRISIFLRPRRFGKTLLLNVFETILRHNGEDLKLLEGTYVKELAKQLQNYTVLRFNFQDQSTIEDFDKRLNTIAKSYDILKDFQTVKEAAFTDRKNQQQIEGRTENNTKPIQFLPDLIGLLKKPVAILVDEYNIVFDNIDEVTREYFFRFFQSLKDLKATGQLEFAFITGCDKVKLNIEGQSSHHGLGTTLGIEDISGKTEFAHLLGFTEKEIKKYYHVLAQLKAVACGKPVEAIYKEMENHYNGYQFGDDDSPKVYNPVSIMNYLMDKENFKGKNYWVKTVPDSTKIERIILENHLLDLNKDVLNLDAYFTEDELFDKGTNPLLENKYRKLGIEALLYRHGYLTTARKTVGEGRRMLKFPNEEALEAFVQSVTNVMAMVKEGTELSKTAWKNIDKTIVDMDGFANTFNDFTKLPAFQFLVRHVSRDFESFFKHFVEAMMKEAVCNGCQVLREETLPKSAKESKRIPDFIFDTPDKRIYVEFKYESSEKAFRSTYFNQLKRYKFHACTIYHPKGEEVRKIKILINLNRKGNMVQWYGPKEYKFNTTAKNQKSVKEAEDQEFKTETFEDNYLTILEAFPEPTVIECTECKPPLALQEGAYDKHIKNEVHRPCPHCGRDDISNMGNMKTHMKHCKAVSSASTSIKPSTNI